MARDALTVTNLAFNDSTEEGTGVTIDPANGVSCDVGGDVSGLFFRVTNTSGTTAYDVTFDAPTDNPAAVRSGLGDLVEEIAANGEEYFTIEGARFLQSDGTLHINFETGMTGAIWAFRLPTAAR